MPGYIPTIASPLLRDRVDGGVALYRAGRVQELLMSGDNSSTHYDEVTAMKAYAMSRGLPEHVIKLDYAGFSTLDTCYRARQVFGLSRVVLVTQRYHLPRALYTCRSEGLQAVGLGLADFSVYPDLRLPYTVREWVSDQKAWWQISVLHSRSRFGAGAGM
mgnify:CR=1 FL=1